MTFCIRIRFSSMVTATTVVQGRIQEFWRGRGVSDMNNNWGRAETFGDPSLLTMVFNVHFVEFIP